jgi:hypothetical protein
MGSYLLFNSDPGEGMDLTDRGPIAGNTHTQSNLAAEVDSKWSDVD